MNIRPCQYIASLLALSLITNPLIAAAMSQPPDSERRSPCVLKEIINEQVLSGSAQDFIQVLILNRSVRHDQSILGSEVHQPKPTPTLLVRGLVEMIRIPGTSGTQFAPVPSIAGGSDKVLGGGSAADPMKGMPLADQIRYVRSFPRIEQRVSAIMSVSSGLRQFMSESQYIRLEAGIESMGRGENVDRLTPLVETVLWNGTYHLAARSASPEIALAARLRGLSQAARRLIYKTVFHKNAAGSVNVAIWSDFLRIAADFEDRSIDSAVKVALLEYTDNFLRTKNDFGNGPYRRLRPIHGRATPHQITVLNQAAERGIQEIESLIGTLADLNQLDPSIANAQLRQDFLNYMASQAPKKKTPPSADEVRAQIGAAMDARLEIVEFLRSTWAAGYVPYPKWLLRNYPAIWSEIMRVSVFNGDFDAAYEAAGFPYSLRHIARWGTALTEEKLREQFIQATDFSPNKFKSNVVHNALKLTAGSWTKAVRKLTGRLMTMAHLREVTPTEIEERAFIAGALTEKSTVVAKAGSYVQWTNLRNGQPLGTATGGLLGEPFNAIYQRLLVWGVPLWFVHVVVAPLLQTIVLKGAFFVLPTVITVAITGNLMQALSYGLIGGLIGSVVYSSPLVHPDVYVGRHAHPEPPTPYNRLGLFVKDAIEVSAFAGAVFGSIVGQAEILRPEVYRNYSPMHRNFLNGGLLDGFGIALGIYIAFNAAKIIFSEGAVGTAAHRHSSSDRAASRLIAKAA